MITIRNLRKRYEQQFLFKGLDLNIEKGSVVTVIGPSGSGKSTLLRCMNGLESFQRGHISFHDQKIYGTDEQNYHKEQERCTLNNIRKRVGMVFQQFNLFPHMTVLQNIREAPVYVLGMNQAEAESHAISLLRKVNLEGKAGSYPGQLSGGEQQRIAIARAMAMNPEALLFDEPTSSLDPEMIDDVLLVIKKLVSEGMTTVIATHEMSFAREISTKVVFLEKGDIVEQGEPQEIFYHPKNDRTKAFLERFRRIISAS
ncbi:MAG: amino acid ABC transporter ATP-binding protein [Candidatus Loosdrechtia sp.]|uniref:amino acid ABC transporter ATP-binding protein n=1 Tax=Candidatus Loosdrechtia sp. TaxID=3101272 RepID=UPI003A688E13|nr:MAG: amino acid ABC transporter ATP-binding protein [Candidatus Jettenia sp. AMX2]